MAAALAAKAVPKVAAAEPKKSAVQIDSSGTPIPKKNKAPTKKAIPDQSEYFNARPKKARPSTAWAGHDGGTNVSNQDPSSQHQQELLRDIMQGQARAIAVRPQTAATTTLKDETRILNKLKYLEKIE